MTAVSSQVGPERAQRRSKIEVEKKWALEALSIGSFLHDSMKATQRNSNIYSSLQQEVEFTTVQRLVCPNSPLWAGRQA